MHTQDAILTRSLRVLTRGFGHVARLLGVRDERGRGGREGRQRLSENGHPREPNDGVRCAGGELALKARKSRRNGQRGAHLGRNRDQSDPRGRQRAKDAAKRELPAPKTTTRSVRANCRKRAAAPMHSKQMTKAGLAECITMPKMRGLRPSHMHSNSMAKGQQQEQQQPEEESRRHRAPACSHVSHCRNRGST